MRKIINFNENWKFLKENPEKAYEMGSTQREWAEISIPHTWNAIDGANGFDFYRGACWYRKTFKLNSDIQNKRVFIEFQGANSVADVYLNEKHIGQHRGGYSTFRFDITEFLLEEKENILAVKVDNSNFDDVYPQVADFTFYGGIYRDVNLIIVNNTHFDLMDYGSQGIYIMQDKVNNENASVNIKTKISNKDNNNRKIRLWAEILDKDNKVVNYFAKDEVLEAESNSEFIFPFTIDNPKLWNGLEDPYMYSLKISLESYNDTIDELIVPFGLRYFEVCPEKGFILNGQTTRLNGVSRHQDRKDMGWAITKKEHEEDLELIKELGANSIRLAHYQHDQYFYDLCNKEGFVLWAEIPFISVMSKTDFEGTNAKQQMIELIRQNFNHPSIFFWGIQNEIQIGGERAEVRKLVKELNQLTKEEDPTRLTTLANVMFVENDDEYNFITDIVGYNKYYGWYQGKAEDFAPWIDEFHSLNPQRALGISEYGAEGIIEYHNNDPKVKDYSEEYHALYHEKVWKIFEDRPFLWATYVWNMFDFGANIRNEGGVQGRNNKGLVTYDRKIRKDAFYMYKAHWSKEKFIHITSKRYIERIEDKIDIKVYSNCNNLTLILNDKEIETIDGRGIFVFSDISLNEGLNKIEVIDKKLDLKDFALFSKVKEASTSYKAPEGEKGGVVSNWFQMPDLEEVAIEELDLCEDVYSTSCSFKDIMQNEEAKNVLIKYLGDFTSNPMYSMMEGMKINMVASMAEDMFTEKVMYILNKELSKIKK